MSDCEGRRFLFFGLLDFFDLLDCFDFLEFFDFFGLPDPLDLPCLFLVGWLDSLSLLSLSAASSTCLMATSFPFLPPRPNQKLFP